MHLHFENQNFTSMSCRMLNRCCSLGSPIWNAAGIRRKKAGSISEARLVAPMTTTGAWFCEAVSRPSHICKKMAFIMDVTSWSLLLRALRKASISSIKMMQGAIFRARVKTATASFSDSPNLLFFRFEIIAWATKIWWYWKLFYDTHVSDVTEAQTKE